SFTYAYDGASRRILSATLPNGQTSRRGYGGPLQDLALQRITHRFGATLLSEFIYDQNVPANSITTWSQQVGADSPQLYTFGYDAADQLVSATVTNAEA